MPMRDQHSLGYLLHHTASVYRRVMGSHTKAFDLTPEQFGLLVNLRMKDGISQKKLAEQMYKDQATTGKIIEKLEAKGLIKRSPDPVDRRAFLLYMTEEAERILDQLAPWEADTRARALRGISDEELELFERVIAKMHDNLQD
ncbi:MarR family winged helix-turn-helix transcriptional regulator [Paenibacillus methanolicus]|uniref:DNA-binding MarR family transcriptional regulator n=1 Tax=Paenibacillus methanolicus TaxID=582686 RepID=A0A5S5C8H6_9BACL|nr:MarR family transcriptional regulator [Paenibacillus methanolicus]TYP74908.1 DNA-binding MarR family transcriptional regulator [Paenibacillus methanolicus]